MKHIPLFFALILLLATFTACDNSAPANSSPAAATATAPAASFPKEEAEKLIKRLATQDGCKDSTAEMRLSFTDSDGKPQQMDFRLQRKYEGSKIATLMTILAPKEESEKALLAFEEEGKPTDAISYLAGLKKVAHLKSDNPLNFRGSKSSVQEMLGMELGQYQLNSASVANGVITLELKAREGMQLRWPRIDLALNEKDKAPMKFEFFDERNEKAKTIQATEVKPIQNFQTITKMEIEDSKNKQKLKLETRNIKYDTNLPASIFTEVQLIKAVTAASEKQLQ